MEPKVIHKKVLISPLDWGLGHSTRCIPIIHWMLKNGFDVIIAASGSSALLLKNEFPNLKFLPLKGYRVQYSYKKRFLPLKILLQVPKILLTIRHEHRWLKRIVDEEKIDLIISDNRFGFYHKVIPSVFITHQLMIFSKSKWMRKWVQKINYKFIDRFSCCWIPDFKDVPNFAGRLSHPGRKPHIPVIYLGPLSRFENKRLSSEFVKNYRICFLLSGPEPQRTLLENKIIRAAPSIKGNLLLLRAKPADEPFKNIIPNLEVINHLPTEELQEKLLRSDFVVSRAGYTTIMELASLNIRGILIPTPGQTEQEYLADHLMKNRWFYCFQQDEDLTQHLQQAFSFPYQSFPFLKKYPFILEDFFKNSFPKLT